MSFASRAWRILVAVKDLLVLVLLLLFFGVIYSVLTATPNAADLRKGALVLALDGSIVEQHQGVDLRDAIAGTVPQASEVQLRDVLHVLDAAAKDDDVQAVVLDLDGFWGGGQASLMQIGEALDAVRRAKKPVLAFAAAYCDDAYLLASHANEIWLDPMGAALFAGPGGSNLYFKGLIDRLGVNARVYRVGKFKSFVEPYTLDRQSPEAKAADQALADALWDQWQDDVAKARPKAKLAAFIADPAGAVAAAGNSLAKAAAANGVVDRLGDRNAFARRMADLVGREDDDPADAYNATGYDDYLAAHPAREHGKIGVLTVAGEIVDGEAAAGMSGGETLSALLLDTLAEDEIAALVVRIDSPGGSAPAAERIRSAIAEAKRKGLPVIASMGDVAASGGYWVATAADKVYAEPSTITGSIGVFGIIPTFENALPKAGITADGVTTTPLSGQPDLLRGTTPQADAIIQAGVTDVYARFLDLVAANRKLPRARVDEIAQGRVWDGGTARQIGLVDAFGSLDAAVAEAARRAKLDPDKAEMRWIEPEAPQLFDVIAGFLGVRAAAGPRDIFSRMVAKEQASLLAGLRDGMQVLTGPAIQARCLACPHPARPVMGRMLAEPLWNRIIG